MKLHEYQAKEILAQYRIPVPEGQVAEKVDAAVEIAKALGFPVVIKAQVLVGGRGKAGGVKIAKNENEVKEFSSQILGIKIKGLPVKKILIYPAVDIAKEYYLGLTVDRDHKTHTLMFSEMGGMDIEEVAKSHPDKIVKTTLTRLRKTIPPLPLGEGLGVRAITENLIEAYFAIDATLVEINPLVKTPDGKLIAVDAKIILDDNALFRHPEMAKLSEAAEEDEIEAEAHRRKIAYVRLPGNIGILGNGAGLVMCTMDEVKRAGGRPASFLDIGGGAKADKVKNALELLSLDKNIKGIFFNVFGGITRCDEVAQGIIETKDKIGIQVPIVIRLTGTREEEGRKLLSETNLIPAVSMQEGAKKIVEMVRTATPH